LKFIYLLYLRIEDDLKDRNVWDLYTYIFRDLYIILFYICVIDHIR